MKYFESEDVEVGECEKICWKLQGVLVFVLVLVLVLDET
jgi:hypothetical protein